MLYDLSIRTPGEDAWLSRKDRGLTQAEEARRLRVSRTTLWGLETGLAPLRSDRRVRFDPSSSDLLLLARRRSGLGLHGVARAAGVSHPTVLDWERRGNPRLIRFWEGRGFTNVQK